MQRAAIYARYSTDLQNDKSVEDQIAICRQLAQREGLSVVAEFYDKAVSGATLHREGVQNLLTLARQGMLDVIIVEAFDRLSRSMGDLATVFDELTFRGIRLLSVHDGEANTMMVGMKGLFAQMFREDNVKKVRRGMQGLVKSGKSAGGRAYGYKADRFNVGALEIVPSEVAIVRRIFSEYLEGKSARTICIGLQADGIPTPRGGSWQPAVILGSEQQGTGILRNRLYAGVRVWNKVRMVKDPATGKRTWRPNPKEEWIVQDEPDLQVIPTELFDQVQALIEARSRATESRGNMVAARRPKRFLSGLLKCAGCGGGLCTVGKDSSGRVRLQCSTHRNNRGCPDPRSYYLDNVEKVVLDAISNHFTNPTLMAEYAKAYQEERRALNKEKFSKLDEVKARIAALDKSRDKLLDLILSTDDDGKLKERYQAEGAEQKRLEQELADMDQPDVAIDLHPAAIKKMAESITSVRDMLQQGIEDGGHPAMQAVREALVSIVVKPRDDTPLGVEVEITGRFAAFSDHGPNDTLKRRIMASGISLVAEEGLEPPTRGL